VGGGGERRKKRKKKKRKYPRSPGSEGRDAYLYQKGKADLKQNVRTRAEQQTERVLIF
jgi:hypothetical protein